MTVRHNRAHGTDIGDGIGTYGPRLGWAGIGVVLLSGLLLVGCGAASVPDPRQGTRTDLRISGTAGIPDDELRRIIDAAMRQCATGAPRDRTTLDAAWTVVRLAPYPQVQVTAALSRAGRTLAAVSATVGSPRSAPDAVFAGAVDALACRLLAHAAAAGG